MRRRVGATAYRHEVMQDLGNAVLSEQLASFAKMMHSMRKHLVRIKLVCVKEVSYKQQDLAAGWLFIWKSGIWKSAARPRPAHQDFFCSFRLGSFRFDEERRNKIATKWVKRSWADCTINMAGRDLR
jgi:hypothetical protein